MRPINISDEGAKKYYYEKDPISNTDGKQENTRWHGKGAEKLGLSGHIKKDDFERVLAGKDPLTGEQLITRGGKKHKHRAGVDIPFSAPKSVSIAALHNGDDRLVGAHDRAVAKTIEHLEKKYAQYRITENSQTRVETSGNWVVAIFRHSTSRENDPQLHSHTLILNMTKTENGWRATHNDQLFKNQSYITSVYSSYLAKEIKDLGYAIESKANGTWEISGYNKKQAETFSKRSEKIEEKEKELSGKMKNANEGQINKAATLGSRPEKDTEITAEELRESWDAQDRANGIRKDEIIKDMRQAGRQSRIAERERTEPRMNEYDYIRTSLSIKTENESVFKKEDILKTANRLSYGEYIPERLEKAYDELTKDRQILKIGQTQDSKNNIREIYTTAEMQKIEQEIVSKVRKGQYRKEAISSKEQVQQSIRDYEARSGKTMTQGQKDAVEHILTSKDRVIGIQGDSGTGKTTMLANVKEQLEKHGYHARGLGFTGKAAAEVEAQAGIKSQTIDSFLHSGQRIESQTVSYIHGKLTIENNPGTKHGKEVWIVDEASMLGSSKMHDLIKAAEKADTRIVFVGDTKQLQAVEAGRMFSKLQETGDLKTVHMSEVQRQKDEQYKGVVNDISEKKIDRAFDKLENQNRISEISDRQERLNTIVKDYTARKDHKDTIIVTARNADRNALNSAIRAELKEQGKLNNKEHTFTVRESKNLSPEAKHFAQSYSEGDRIVANEAGIIGGAGREAKVTNIDQQNHKITVQTKDGKEHQIDLKTQGQHLAAYQEKQQSFSQGDKVVFLKKDKSLKLENGYVGEIKSIEKDGRAVIKMENGKNKTINLKSQYNYLDHGYAVTDYKAQGQTSKDVIYHADTSKGVNYNQAYVAITRGEHDLKIYTDNKENLREQMKIEQNKTSTLDYESEGRGFSGHSKSEDIARWKEIEMEI